MKPKFKIPPFSSSQSKPIVKQIPSTSFFINPRKSIQEKVPKFILAEVNIIMEEMGAEKRRLVVIGGGIAGSMLAKSLQFHADVTFIDPYVLYSFSFYAPFII